MFLISDGSCTDVMMVSNVQGSISDENRVSVTWNWPKSAALKYCIVFAVEDDLSLEEILSKKIPGTVYEDSFGLRHTMELEKQSIMFKIFPARKNEKGDLEIVNQLRNNASPVLYKRIHIYYHVEYKSSIFSNGKTAYLQVRGMDNVKDGYLVYRCVGDSRSDILYPIDIEQFKKQGTFEIHLDKKEEIILTLIEDQKGYVTLNRF